METGFDYNNQKEFNSGLAIIYQLDGIEKGLVDVTAQNSDGKLFEQHFNLLKSYFKTLFPFMKENKKFQEQTYHKNKWLKLRRNVLQIKSLISKGKQSVPCELVDALDEWEIELRDLKQKRGLGMPERDARYRT